MKGSIPRTFIDDILTKINIVDLINSRVKLKKPAVIIKPAARFTNEKTPSFTVSDKSSLSLFRCGAHGNAISFLMEYDKLEFLEAVGRTGRVSWLGIPYEKRLHFKR